MASEARILAFAGSTRRESYNKRLVKIAAEGAREAGGIVSVIDLADFPLPLFDADLEASQGPPDSALRLKTLMTSHDGFPIASSEYNSSPSAVLKNAIDWAGRASVGGVQRQGCHDPKRLAWGTRRPSRACPSPFDPRQSRRDRSPRPSRDQSRFRGVRRRRPIDRPESTVVGPQTRGDPGSNRRQAAGLNNPPLVFHVRRSNHRSFRA